MKQGLSGRTEYVVHSYMHKESPSRHPQTERPPKQSRQSQGQRDEADSRGPTLPLHQSIINAPSTKSPLSTPSPTPGDSLLSPQSAVWSTFRLPCDPASLSILEIHITHPRPAPIRQSFAIGIACLSSLKSGEGVPFIRH